MIGAVYERVHEHGRTRRKVLDVRGGFVHVRQERRFGTRTERRKLVSITEIAWRAWIEGGARRIA